MTQYGYNPKYITKNGRPWFPIMGEFHYSRYPRQFWRESLYKMKAGGVQVVSSYVIWIHHEEVEGEYDFEGVRDLRAFVEMCAECGLEFFIRIGPWCHGEVRNGGLPDWMLKKDFEPRTNDERYFDEVWRFYNEIYAQVAGLMLKDGGPIIGVQIENEYGHVGGLQGEEGERHMQRLAQLARQAGFDAPLYTATGWGGAVTGGLLPVMGGYCEAPWDQRSIELEPSVNYVFTHERNDHGIACDHGVDASITFEPAEFPYLTAELGGGLQVTHHRRPVASAADIGAMSMVKLGSGVNLLGYYMYHGGTNPKGKLSSMQESRATGYPNDLPELSYDFRASVREYGQVSETLREIKLLAMFAADFGEELCGMPAYIPEENPTQPEDLTSLRSSVRHDGKSGYVFVNNYQRRYKMAEHKNVKLLVELESERVEYPALDVADGFYAFFPCNMEVRGGRVKSALATPLCRLNKGTSEETTVFYADIEPEYTFEGEVQSGAVLTLSRRQALDAWRVCWDGREHLIICSGAVVETETAHEAIVRDKCVLRVYPKPGGSLEGFERMEDEGEFAVFAKTLPLASADVMAKRLSNTEADVYEIEVQAPQERDDVFLRIDYAGDAAELYIDGEKVADDFYSGETWEVGLKKFGYPAKLRLEILPLYKEDDIYLQKWPEMREGRACRLENIGAVCERRVELVYKAKKQRYLFETAITKCGARK